MDSFKFAILIFIQAKQQGLTCCKVPFDFENAQSSWTISTCWYDINVALWKHAIEELLLGEGFFLDEEDSKNLSLMHYSGKQLSFGMF